MILTAPFQIDDLKKIVSGDIKEPLIDVHNSKVKNQSLLTYIYNLNLTDVKLEVSHMSLKDRRDLFVSYLNHKTIISADGLPETYLRFLFNLKEISDIDDESEEQLNKSIFTKQEVSELMTNDTELRDLIERAAFLLDGIVVHLMLSLNDVQLLADENFQKVGVVHDKSWIGHTWINLLKNTVFNLYYYSKMPELKELVYFPYYYSESIYKGQPLISFLAECSVASAVMDMSASQVKETLAS